MIRDQHEPSHSALLTLLAQRPIFSLQVIRIEGVAEMPLLHVNPLTIKSAAVPSERTSVEEEANGEAIRETMVGLYSKGWAALRAR